MKYLFFHLRRHGDIISSLPSMLSLQKSGHQISIVVYEEFLSSAKLANTFHRIHVIRRKEIISTFKSQNLNPQIGSDILFNLAREIEDEGYDSLVNWTNDKISGYLIAYLQNSKNKFHGLSFEEAGKLVFSDTIAKRFNNLFGQKCFQSFNQISVQNALIGNLKTAGNITIDTSEYDSEIQSAFNSIRIKNRFLSKLPQLVGISPLASTSEKSLSFKLVRNLIDKMLDDPNVVPLLLIGFSKDEEEFATSLTNEFSDTLVVVQCNIVALASALKQLDFVISPDSMAIHLASILNVKGLEITFSSKWKRQAPISQNILTLIVSRERLENVREFEDSLIERTLNYIKTGTQSLLSSFTETYRTATIGNFSCSMLLESNPQGVYSGLIDYLFMTEDHEPLKSMVDGPESTLQIEEIARIKLKDCYIVSSALRNIFKAFEGSKSESKSTRDSLRIVLDFSTRSDSIGAICSFALEELERDSGIVIRSEINSYLKHYVKTIECVLHYVFKSSQELQIRRKKEIRHNILQNNLSQL